MNTLNFDGIEITPQQAEQFLNQLQVHMATRAALSKKSNDELALLLIDHIWAYMPAGPNADLVDECIDRLLSPEGRAKLEASDE